MREPGGAEALGRPWPPTAEKLRRRDGLVPAYNSELEACARVQLADEVPGSGAFRDEVELMELAAELLEVRDEAELDLFLGRFIKRAGQAIRQVVKLPVGKAIGGMLKGAAKQALPIAGTALGGLFGGPVGAAVGSGLASMADKALGLELEGLSLEDQEYEGAKRFVRLAAAAVKNAAMTPTSVDATTTAQAAAVSAAQQHAPGLLAPSAASAPPPATAHPGSSQSGRWVRRGNMITVYGV